MKTPVEALQEKAPQISPDVAAPHRPRPARALSHRTAPSGEWGKWEGRPDAHISTQATSDSRRHIPSRTLGFRRGPKTTVACSVE
jgi:hypothetical protein